VHTGIRLKFQKLVPACLLVLGLMLVLRGMALGIPYVSPDLGGHAGSCPFCP